MQSLAICTCLALLAAGAPTHNEAVHDKILSEEEILQNMTHSSAMQIFMGMEKTSPSADHRELALVMRTRAEGDADQTNLRSISVTSPVMKTQKMFNKLIQATQMKREVETIRCQEFERKQVLMLKEARMDINTFNSQASGARAEVLRYQAQISLLTQKIPEALLELKQLSVQCTQDEQSLRAEMSQLKSDAIILKKVLKMIKCKGSQKSASLLQCNCTDGQPVFALDSEVDGITDALQHLNSNVAKQYLQSGFLETYRSVPSANILPVMLQDAERAADGVRRQLGVCEEEEEEEDGNDQDSEADLLELDADVGNSTALGADLGNSTELDADTGYSPPTGQQYQTRPYPTGTTRPYPTGTTRPYPTGSTRPYPTGTTRPYPTGQIRPRPIGSTRPIQIGSTRPIMPPPIHPGLGGGASTKPYLHPAPCAVLPNRPAKLPPPTSHRCIVTNKCSVATNPKCSVILDKFMSMWKNVDTQIAKIKIKLVKITSKCKFSRNELRTEIQEMQSTLADAQTSLAIATKTQDQAESQSQHVSLHYKRLDKEYRIEMKQCCINQNEFTSEKCALTTLREELDKLTNTGTTKPFKLVDCEVSSWIPEECSQSCGGGVQMMTRSIVTPPQGGVDCPPLRLSRSCNTQDCPVDCEMGEWGGWSACTADCGGGVMQRMRDIKVNSLNGGTPCQSQTDSRSCNIQSCDADCELSEWSDWTPCSKACGGGTQSHTRRVTKAQRGNGQCPSTQSSERIGFKPCNSHACVVICPPNRPLVCKSRVDVIIIMDGSGSVREAGFAQSKRFVDQLLNSFMGGTNEVRVAQLLFSGPSNVPGANACVPKAGDMSSLGQGIDEKYCKMTWVSKFTSDIQGLRGKNTALQFPKGGTNTAMALGLAEQELLHSRSGTNSIVILLTDGVPMSKTETQAMANKVKQKARLVTVGVGPAVKQYGEALLKAMASPPASDNVLMVSDFAALTSKDAINSVISSACPNVG